MRALKLLGWVLLTLLVIIVVAVAAYVLTFDPNAYKAEIIESVRTHLGREIEIPGDLRLSLFPPFTLEAGQAVLYEKGRRERFASVDRVRLRLAIGPLLSKRLQIDGVSIDGLSVEIIRDRQGRLNIDDLYPSGPGALPDYFVQGISVDRARFRFRDEASGGEYALTDIKAALTPVAPAQRGRLMLRGVLRLSDPQIEGPVDVETDFIFNSPAAALLLEQTQATWRFAVEGAIIESSMKIASLAVKDGIQVGQVEIDAALRREDKENTVTLTVPGIAWHEGVALQIPARLVWKGAAGNWKAVGSMGCTVDAAASQPVRLSALETQATFETGEFRATAHFSGAADYDAGSRKATMNLSAIELDITKEERNLAEIRGAFQAKLDLSASRADAKFGGTFNDSRAAALLEMPLKTPVRARFNANLAALDMDRIVSGAAAGTGPGRSSDLDLAPLRELGIAGELLIGQVKHQGVTAKGVRIRVE
jgi:AsmA family